jgi:RNA polymerase sigma-70 factor (ECF subfamily)
MLLRRSSKRRKDHDVIRAERITETSWRDLVRAVRSYVGRRVTNPEDRDDLVQDVMLRIHGGLAGLKAQDKPGPWIYGIAHNVVIDHWRRKGRPTPVPIEDAEATLGEIAAIVNDGDDLQQTVAAYVADQVTGLESPYRETLTLTELKGMKYADAADTLGISLAAVKSRVLRGRQMLRKALIRCCEIEVAPTGRIIACAPRSPGNCACESSECS